VRGSGPGSPIPSSADGSGKADNKHIGWLTCINAYIWGSIGTLNA